MLLLQVAEGKPFEDFCPQRVFRLLWCGIESGMYEKGKVNVSRFMKDRVEFGALSMNDLYSIT